jgi:hypothetical protein
MTHAPIDHVRTLVATHAAVLSDEDRHLIDRHFAEVERLLLVVVGIVRRATLRGSPGVPAPSQALEVGGHVQVATERGGR